MDGNQSDIWFRQKTNPDNANSFLFARLTEIACDLDIDVLSKAIEQTLSEAQTLRARIFDTPGHLCQSLASVAGAGDDVLHVINFSDQSDSQQAIDRWVETDLQQPMDLQHWLLIRFVVFRVGATCCFLYQRVHHTIGDGFALQFWSQRLAAVYAAFTKDKLPPSFPWQDLEQLLNEESNYRPSRAFAQDQQFWRAQLADAPVRLDLPTDRPRPARQSFAGAFVPIELDAELSAALRRLSQQHGVTLFMTLLAAWAAVLSRLSGQLEIVIGAPSANRGQQEIEPLIGFFVNTLALRVTLEDNPSVTELLARVKAMVLQAQAHQDLPFEQVVEIVQPPRQLDHTPIFQVMFAWQNNGRSDMALPELDISSLDAPYDVIKFDLDLNLTEADDRIVGGLGYATALFERSTIERQVQYLKRLLAAMATEAEQPVAKIDLLDPAERTLLLKTWNDTRASYPAEQQCIHH
ncbi:condensation domain-containing protein, partial [Burkholderia ubonensis]|uniref:condensation domain-containing protein n=1 Tax=Burkholderia ubonensis TaxID=101571 RepID=UPI001E56A6AF